MPSYKVVRPCYIPIGEGAKYKTMGQVITISAEEAKNLDGYIVPLGAPVFVRNPDTGITVRNPDTGITVRNPDTFAAEATAGAILDEEVAQHDGDQTSDDE